MTLRELIKESSQFNEQKVIVYLFPNHENKEDSYFTLSIDKKATQHTLVAKEDYIKLKNRYHPKFTKKDIEIFNSLKKPSDTPEFRKLLGAISLDMMTAKFV